MQKNERNYKTRRLAKKKLTKEKGGKKVYENTAERILKAQNGNEEEMTKLIEENNRTDLEHSKKIHRKRI